MLVTCEGDGEGREEGRGNREFVTMGMGDRPPGIKFEPFSIHALRIFNVPLTCEEDTKPEIRSESSVA